MKKKGLILVWVLAISMVLVAATGAYIKFGVLKPLGLYQDKNFVELPFLLLSEPEMREAIQDAKAQMNHPEQTDPGNTDTAGSDPTNDPNVPTDNTTGDPGQPGIDPSDQPSTSPSDTVPPATDPPSTTTPTDPSYEPVPGFEFSGPAVDLSWFDDVLFIGDSRTVGLRDYARSGKAEYFCGVGMSSFNILTKTASDDGFSEQKLETLLASRTYGKIFISLGINECGYAISSLMKAYQKVVDTVRQAQPDAVIILHGIMNVGKKYAAGKDCFQPAHLAEINERIKELANGTDTFYIDVNEVFADEEGYLLTTVSKDGCHLYAKYDKVWAEWIRYAVADQGL